MRYNESVIPHYHVPRVPLEDLKTMVKIDYDHLKEKSSWYIIDGQLCFFKERDEARMFSEIFESLYGELLGFDTAKYSLAYIREQKKVGRSESKLGLLSPNYQRKDYNYYLVSDLLRSNIANLSSYGVYSLENLIAYFEQEFASVDGARSAIEDTLKLYIFDYFNNQTDRNPKNLCYEFLVKPPISEGDYWGLHGKKVIQIKLATVFDSEKSLGIVKGPKGYEMTDDSLAWESALPYSEIIDAAGFDVDPNILGLYIDHTSIVKPFIERLAYEDEYRKVIENFDQLNSMVKLDPLSKEHLLRVFLGKQNELKRLLTL